MAIFFHSNISANDDCVNWFKNTGLKKDKNCLIDCHIAKTDMGTFHCPDLCPKLCKISNKQKIVFKLSYLYPGLTKAERTLTAKHPKK